MLRTMLLTFHLVLLLAACDEPCTITPVTEPVTLGRGVNLGNMLDAPSEGDFGISVEEEYFDLIKQAGFDFVRLPVNWKGNARHMGRDDADVQYEIDPEFFARVDEVICWGLAREIRVILEFHRYEDLMREPNLDQFAFLWKQIAEHYKDYPPQLLFELVNEPHDQLTADLWNRYVAHILGVVRASNPTRDVVIGSANWSSFDSLPALEIPEDDHLIATFHYYKPEEFTHQGAVWVDGSDAWMGTTWDGTPEQEAEIARHFDLVADWARQHGKIRILLGEFGAYSKAPQDSRIRWMRFVREAAGARGFGWAYWEFASDFGIYDPEAQAWREDLRRALIP